ncbi:MAG TPA: hypothetical protein ENH92_04940 [Ectothiorhodospiraceae bacterium]|nr:hypothetical protein [Ectothiorhodospiraceae bacterium]
MMQQINLYQPIFRKEEKIFSAKTLLIGNLLVLIGLVVLYGGTFWQGETLQTQLSQAISQRDVNRNQIGQLSAQYPQKIRDPQLAIRIANAKGRLTFLHEVTSTLSSQINGIEGGFSEHLAGLSRQDIPKLWLKQITISDGGSELRLHGSTLNSDRVPYYIQQLSRENIFQGTSFHRLSIRRPVIDEKDREAEPPSEVINFTLETALKTPSDNQTISSRQNSAKRYQRWDVKSPGQIFDERMR